MACISTFLRVAALSAVVMWASDLPRPVPPLNLTTPTGEKISLESLRGKVVLLEFFLTECPHCQRSAGAIEPLYKQWRARGLEVVAVAINPDAKQRISEFRQRFNTTYPIALGDQTMVRTVGDLSVVKQFFVPYMFIIDRKGAIRYEHPGGDAAFYDNEAVNLRNELDALLKEPASARADRKPAPKS